ncbi:MAG: Asp-tRNA(Asn)/Glu-tRNA(Gln) amidotransferase subunit GatC [Casimicrobiaceae bacterium]|nr:Asp-tRNA(Asn)/Glu-tRNA(Gln) amidotransferase subunit GatC [Casimicrobiaceae bacterium]MCX8099208.1 Asp-tRNA(Asn)/Glu-tRNA(Gln) amidotransferase subunit GatC [Casimicrobiaceae bacterium]MDW8311418.1 Asp-tRNA(Asn)/Glu-tRNA(Gln) amidotransferase subunit GatC [Burkholderiales bacterium]
MRLSTTEIERIAQLARLAVTSEEVADVAAKLEGIFRLIEAMRAVDTSGVEPMTHGLDRTLRLRADQVTESNRRDALLANAPESEAGYFLVPRVIE